MWGILDDYYLWKIIVMSAVQDCASYKTIVCKDAIKLILEQNFTEKDASQANYMYYRYW